MKMGLTIFAALISVVVAMSRPDLQSVTDKGGDILIIFSGNALGELKPCGCAKEEDQGGIERRMTYLKQALGSTKNTLLVDTGDGFNEATRQGKLKARFLTKSMGMMKYDAVTLGDKDTVYGNKFIGEIENIPWLSSNIELTGVALPKYRIKKFEDGLKVAVLAVSDPKLFYTKEGSDVKVTDPVEALSRILRDVMENEKPGLVVVLSHMAREEGLKLLDLEGVDIVINGHIETENDVIDMEPVRKDGKIFVQPGPKGQKMGELRVSMSARGSPSGIASGGKKFDHRMVPLDSKVKFDPEMVKLYSEYNEEVEELFMASLAAKRKKNQTKVYATDSVCMTCHKGEHETWQNSRHGHAYETLTRVNKSFDPECLVCHTVGFDQPGGFISEIDTPELKNVQCEVCHGPGAAHAKSPGPGFGKQARTACKMCHVKAHSPRFSFADYWPRIEH